MHLQQIRFGRFLIVGALGLMLAGCGANVGKTVKVSEAQLAKYEALSTYDAIATLEQRVNAARNADMPFLAPNYFRGASEILGAVRKDSEKKPKNELIGEIARADAILDKGQTMMTLVQSRLTNELALKKQLDQDNVPQVYPKEFENVLNDLSSLVEKVELEKTGNLEKDKIELIKKMQTLDVRTIQYSALHQSEVINEDTQSKDGQKLAPIALAEALNVYQKAMERIAEAPHDEAAVKRAGDDALFAAHHARYVGERIPALHKTFKESPETLVLDEEKRLLGISSALNSGDLRDRPLDKQAEEIARLAGDTAQELQKAKQAIGSAADQDKAKDSRMKETNDALQQAKVKLDELGAQLADKTKQLTEKDAQLTGKNAQAAEQDAQLKLLNEKIAQLEQQNQALLADVEAAKAAAQASAAKPVAEAPAAPAAKNGKNKKKPAAK